MPLFLLVYSHGTVCCTVVYLHDMSESELTSLFYFLHAVCLCWHTLFTYHLLQCLLSSINTCVYLYTQKCFFLNINFIHLLSSMLSCLTSSPFSPFRTFICRQLDSCRVAVYLRLQCLLFCADIPYSPSLL